MSRKYRVVTKNFSASQPYIICTDWQTYHQCKKWIIGRWKCFPGWAFITSISSWEELDKKFME